MPNVAKSHRRFTDRSIRLSAPWQILACLACLALPASAQDATSQIKAEIVRLQQSLKTKPASLPDLPRVSTMIGNSLTAAAASLSAGRLYLSLEQLGQATDLLHGVRAYIDKADAVKSGLPAYETEWEKANVEITAVDAKAAEKNWDNVPAAIRALSEAAQGRSIPLLEGGRGFAAATGPKDGLLYLGQAQGEAGFAAFCATLDFRRHAAPYPLRSMLPEIEGLQEKTDAAYQPPRSIELHPRFIALNSTLKMAGELDAEKLYAGALYEYLEAVRHFGMLSAPPLDASAQSSVQGELAGARRQLESSDRDDSIAQLFLERAESQVALRPDGSAPSADEWRSARVTVEQVLPAYYAALKPAAPLQQAAGKTVTITLVRWPYT
ncbi:MAG TPA: hypothetical protein VL523_01775 [Terriglobia bacterium]|nr:hypothetical protein [Terriglobia bacterium]